MVVSLLPAAMAVAEDNWGGDLEIYAWLPVIDIESADGTKSKVTRDDIISDLDITALWAARLQRGRWSLASDFVYLDISSGTDLSLVPSLARVTEAGLKAWIVTPNVGYTMLQNDKQKIELYAGARYFWLEVDTTIEIDPIGPGEPASSRKESDTISSWDGVLGARGLYYLSDKWDVLYSVNGGAGDSDMTWGAQAGFSYKYSKLDAAFGWRYLNYDIGDDTLLKELNLNGPFVGVIFRW